MDVLVGGWGSAMLDAAAAHAHRWNVAWDVPPAVFRTLSAHLDERCRARGRDPATIARTVGLTMCVGGDDQIARALERRSRVPFLRDLTREGLQERIIVGSVKECATRLRAYGADEVIVTSFDRDSIEMVETVGAVAAALR